MRNVFTLLVMAALMWTARGPIAQLPQPEPAAGSTRFTPDIPRTWDLEALKDLELPIAGLGKPPVLVSPEYYYRIPVRPIYKSYAVYRPDREPPGYWEAMLKQDPEIIWGGETKPQLRTAADWIRAGELVFESPIVIGNGSIDGPYDDLPVRDPQWYTWTGAPLTREGILPFYRYVIREKGQVELGILSCAMCHTRVLPDGTLIKGAQGNFPFDRAFADDIRKSNDAEISRYIARLLFDAPWIRPNPLEGLDAQSVDEMAAAHEVVPAGVLVRHGAGVWSPVQIPDLIGVAERRYLDHTGLQRNRGIGDLMRYAALNQGADLLSRFGEFVPLGTNQFRGLPEPEAETRYSDEQLYALALYLDALEPPPNPNLPTTPEQQALVERGARIFQEEGCARCHDPKQGYTNNKLVAAHGFVVPPDHPAIDDIMRQRVGTDETLATRTRRGTGLYKVPSLRGLWYRSNFEHNGSCLTLEDWFDPGRLEEDYVPTGWKGPHGTTTRAVKGHEFGLDLSPEEKEALIAFLKTL